MFSVGGKRKFAPAAPHAAGGGITLMLSWRTRRSLRREFRKT